MQLPKAGKTVTVTRKDGLEVTGRVLPSERLVLKLDNGYNLGFSENNIKEIT